MSTYESEKSFFMIKLITNIDLINGVW